MKDRTFFAISALIFGAAAATHVLRVLNRWEMELGPWEVPMWISWVCTIVAAVLSLGAFRKSLRKGPKPEEL